MLLGFHNRADLNPKFPPLGDFLLADLGCWNLPGIRSSDLRKLHVFLIS